MNDMIEYLAVLAAVGGIVTATITGMRAKTTVSARGIAILAIVLGPVVAMLAHASGFLDLADVADPLDYALSAVWGLVASFAGAGLTDANLFHAVAPPKE